MDWVPEMKLHSSTNRTGHSRIEQGVRKNDWPLSKIKEKSSSACVRASGIQIA
jgi:hypothetical protein